MVRTIDAVSEFDQKVNKKNFNRDRSDLAAARGKELETWFGDLKCADEEDQNRSVVVGSSWVAAMRIPTKSTQTTS